MVTVRSVANMRPSAFQPSQPSLSEMAAPISADADDRAGLGADQHGDRQLRPPRGAGGRQRVADDRGQADREAELAEVEDELDGGQPAVEQQHQRRAEHAGQHQPRRAGEHEAEHERHVAERERVRVAAELEVHDAALGDEEADRQPPPARCAACWIACRSATGPRNSRTASVQMAAFSHHTACKRLSAPRFSASRSIRFGLARSIGIRGRLIERGQAEAARRARMFRRTYSIVSGAPSRSTAASMNGSCSSSGRRSRKEPRQIAAR